MEEQTKSFEQAKKLKQDGTEFWSARELSHLLGYSTWDRFKGAIRRAEVACKNSGCQVNDHFCNVAKMVEVGSGATRSAEDYELTRC